MKYALVTGGSRGIGRAVALRLSRDGMPVIVNYVSNDAAAEETKQMIENQGGVCELLKFDIANAEAVDAALEGWENAHPDDFISVLVNNAGTRRDNLMIMLSDEDWHSVIDAPLNGFFYITRRVVKTMLRKREGRIVNMASLSGLKGCPDRPTTVPPRPPLLVPRKRWPRRSPNGKSPSTLWRRALSPPT